MIIDGRSIPAGSTIEADICVVGAGPAGISLALQLIDEPGVRVALIESGGLEWDQRTQSLSDAKVKGQKYYPVTETHLRVFGGSSLSYGGVCTDLGEIDFVERPWVPESGWPFAKDALDPYRERADEILGVRRIDPEDGVGENSGGTKWETVSLSRPLVRFGKKYRETIENGCLAIRPESDAKQPRMCEWHTVIEGAEPVLDTSIHTIEVNDAQRASPCTFRGEAFALGVLLMCVRPPSLLFWV